MKKALILLSAVLLVALMAIPALAEFPLEDFTIPDAGVHFTFNGDAKDENGALTGELVGDPTFVEGRDGTANGAIYLDDSEQYIFLGKYVDAENYTASFWCKVEDNTEHVFLCSSILGSIRIIHDGGVVVGNTINGVVDNLSDYEAPRDEWVNMTFVYTGAEEKMDIYANGELVGSLSGALPLPFTLLGNEASEQKGWQSYPFLTLDEAWFYGRAFTADEVKTLFNDTNVSGAAAPAAPAEPAGDGAYPASGESGNFMMGKIIGNETGWDGTAGSGAASAFDGNPDTFFDPLGVGDGFCGMEYDEPYILEKVAILSRSTFLDRFLGGSIEGSNDGEEWETLWESDDVAPSATEYNIATEFENNYGYKMFRYINWINHGDVAEVEFYGTPGTAERPAKEEPAPAAEEPKAEEPTAQEVVENAAEAVGEAVGDAAENVAEAAENAAEAAQEAVSNAVESAKSGCGSFLGGGLIVLVTVLGSAWIARRR